MQIVTTPDAEAIRVIILSRTRSPASPGVTLHLPQVEVMVNQLTQAEIQGQRTGEGAALAFLDLTAPVVVEGNLDAVEVLKCLALKGAPGRFLFVFCCKP